MALTPRPGHWGPACSLAWSLPPDPGCRSGSGGTGTGRGAPLSPACRGHPGGGCRCDLEPLAPLWRPRHLWLLRLVVPAAGDAAAGEAGDPFSALKAPVTHGFRVRMWPNPVNLELSRVFGWWPRQNQGWETTFIKEIVPLVVPEGQGVPMALDKPMSSRAQAEEAAGGHAGG